MNRSDALWELIASLLEELVELRQRDKAVRNWRAEMEALPFQATSKWSLELLDEHLNGGQG